MKHIGTTYPIHDAELKASGKAIYAGDMKLDKMLHMAILFSTIPHGKVKKLDYSKAFELEGVVDIIDCFNFEHNTYSRYHTQIGQNILQKPVHNVPPARPIIFNERIFNEHVRFVGDRVAGVIAETEEIARKAVSLIEVEYEEYPFALTAQETLTGIIDNVHKEGAVLKADPFTVGEVCTDDDLITVESSIHLSRINHLCMETHACVATYNKYTKELEVFSPNQAVFGIRTQLATIFDMDFNKIRVVKTTMGGSFGAKQEWVLEPVAAAAAIRTGRPVKLVYNRNETIVSTYSRSPIDAVMKVDYKPDGTMCNVDCDVTLDAGAYVGNSVNYLNTLGTKFSKTYEIKSVKYDGRTTITNTIVSGAFRGWTAPEANTIMEHNVNIAAKKLGMDPYELRLKNAKEPYTIDIKYNVSLNNLKTKETLTKGCEMFDWYGKKEEVAKFNAENTRYKRGIGVASSGHVSGFYPFKSDFARVDMRLTESGTVSVNATIHDHGCGTVTAFKMIAAETLGLDVDDIKIKEGDTDVTPFDFGCYSSRTTVTVGKATYGAAVALKERIKKHFADLEGVDINDVETEGKFVYCKSNREIGYPFTELVRKSQQLYQAEIFVTFNHTPTQNDIVAGTNFAYVEVDTYTGMTKVLDFVSVLDIGQAINREICVAQTQGAVQMSAGSALSEHIKYRKNGVPFGGLKDYHVFNSYEAPSVRVAFIEDGNCEGPYDSKSIGEACNVPPAAALMGAVNNALDSDISTIPMSPDVICEYLAKRG